MSENEVTNEAMGSEDSIAPVSRKEKVVKEVKSITLILTVVLVFRSVFFEPFRIPSGSMIPTLMIGDFILVNKFSYGFKVPFSDLSMFGVNLNPIYMFGESDPTRGDVIVFKYPKDPSINYIKRVVGVPGDRIEIKNKVVFINGEPINAKEVSGKAIMEDMDEKFKNYNLKFYKVKTGEAEHIIQQDSDNYYKTDYQQKTIPKDRFFVMGDNRDFSYDSRFWGFVKREQVKGRALFVWFSMIFPFGEDSFKFRPWRIGSLIK